jgi:hypothetical protein
VEVRRVDDALATAGGLGMHRHFRVAMMAILTH